MSRRSGPIPIAGESFAVRGVPVGVGGNGCWLWMRSARSKRSGLSPRRFEGPVFQFRLAMPTPVSARAMAYAAGLGERIGSGPFDIQLRDAQ